MSSTMLTRPPLAGPEAGVANDFSPSLVNSYGITFVAGRLARHLQPGHPSDPVEFFNLCLSLSRGIDYALARNQIPMNAQDLPKLLKQICQQKNNNFLQAAIMVLMISVKHACNLEWFSPKDNKDLLAIFDEMGKSYCSTRDVDAGSSHYQSSISTIMERFYPKLKMGLILASLEVKPGYGAFAADFHIPKSTAPLQDKIWLFVAHIDNLETSACLITPQRVSFLLNGKGVGRRTNVLVEPEPQMPTNVTGMLKYGTNLLQVVGQFYGHYLVLVAFMSHKSLPENAVIPDYVPPAVTSLDSDSDIMEGASQISLTCPISFTRIKTPVKGRSCKHFQCFDFDNFININSRRPSWRCPHCSQYVCYPDICLDRNMVEILKNVGDNVAEVLISADGSWKAVFRDDADVDKMQNDARNSGKEAAEPKECPSFPGALPDVLDLTNDDDMEILDAGETTDIKPHLADLQTQPTTSILATSGLNSAGVNQDVAAQAEDDFWPGVHLTSGGSDPPTIVGNCAHPILTDAIAQATNQEAVDHGITLTSNLSLQNQFTAPNNFQMQQSNYLNTAVLENGRSQQIPRHVNRNPVAVQALPAQCQALGPQQRSRTNLSPLIPGSSTVAPHVSGSSPANGFSPIVSDTERRQHFSRPTVNLPQVVGATVSISQHHSPTQNRAPQMANASVPSQPPNPYAASSLLRHFQNAHLQQALNPRSRSIGQSSSAVDSNRSPIPLGRSQSGITPVNGQPARDMNAGRMIRPPAPLPIQNQSQRDQSGNVRGPVQSMPMPDGSFNLQSESDWRPTGRMRGSLTGRQYPDAVRQLIIQPTQSTQSVRPLGPLSVRPSSVLHQPGSAHGI
ncbi:E4 SUMO-protein ligase PIAL2 isoform X2 [Neltuma alba]|uniref:E4 SUMO-protein ligase PIAL2 isoform X2 n=1 Tax=Neltuma alba TaxID=207710 RepID=UPI0010A44758|nr:E4 SUMO-protein ligase PIAL2 isoform X2 [Prosopis alba]